MSLDLSPLGLTSFRIMSSFEVESEIKQNTIYTLAPFAFETIAVLLDAFSRIPILISQINRKTGKPASTTVTTMGLPQQPDNNPSTTSAETSIPNTTSSPPSRADQLPPEALALATKLFDYARQGSTPELSQYLSAGIPSNLTNHKGDTLLMLAAYHGHPETVKVLVEKGADVDAVNDRGQSPVAGAVFKGEEEVVRVLVEAGADLVKGQPNAWEAAVMFRREEVLRMFREAGKEPPRGREGDRIEISGQGGEQA